MKILSKVKASIKQAIKAPFKKLFAPISKKLSPMTETLSEKFRNFQLWYEDTKLYKILNHPYMFVLPYALLFFLLILLPTMISGVLSTTYFNTIQAPSFVGFKNYVNLFTADSVFLQKAVPNTFKFAIIVGPLGYMLSFALAWLLAQVTPKVRTIYTLCIYSPSITGPIMMGIVWKVLFSGDQAGYINYFLMKFTPIKEPVQFLQDPNLLFPIMIIIALWSSAGIGFLAMLAGLLNIDRTLYEAAYIDGIKNRWQEIFYITIPAMKPQMLFGAVMAIVGAFNISGVAAALSGGTPPPQYTGWMIMDHASDFGFIRYEMGYASAVTVMLFAVVIFFNRISYKLFGDHD
ncbi:carbohydrate ABC transporter permease [Haloplasma contractile]